MHLLMTITKRLLWFITLIPLFFVGLVILVIIAEDMFYRWEEWRFHAALDDAIEKGEADIPLYDLTQFEWNKICVEDHYRRDETVPLSWDLNFYHCFPCHFDALDESDELMRSYEFSEEKYGVGYSRRIVREGASREELLSWCVDRQDALLLRQG